MAAMIYHLVPEKLIGMRLIPLNRMSGDLASQHASGIAKYSGREKLLQRQIPKLDCLWNDVLHFSSVDPRIVFGRLEELGLGNFKAFGGLRFP